MFAIIEAVKEEGHGCPVKEIFLAREILRRLQPDAEDLYQIRQSVVHSAIMQSLQVIYAELTTWHNGRFPKYDKTVGRLSMLLLLVQNLFL